MTTLIQIVNTGAAAQIVHVRIWSDTGLVIFGFNVVLSGYDAQAINIRDILIHGMVPQTGTSGTVLVSGSAVEAGPVDGSPDLLQPGGTDTLADRCSPAFHPGYPVYDPIPGSTLALIQGALQQSQLTTRRHNDCVNPTGYPLSDWFESRTTADPTWMYVTADVVWTCTRLMPDDAAYWVDGPSANPGFDPNGGQRMDDNVLTGNLMWLNPSWAYSEAMLAVHVEADPNLGSGTPNVPVRNPTSGLMQTFYHDHSAPHGLSDDREPLPTAWAFRYLDDNVAHDTYIRVWKTPGWSPDLDFAASYTTVPTEPWVRPNYTFSSEMEARDCLAYTYYSWDEDENVTSGGIEPNSLPLRTQEVAVDQLSTVGDSGWMLFLWPGSNAADSDLYQTWMGVKQVRWGESSSARPALETDNFNCVRWLFASGFELGSTAGWHRTTP